MAEISDDIRTVISSCPHDCPDSCAMLIDVRDDRIVDVRGNPDHPFTRGGLCIKVNNYGDRVHNARSAFEALAAISEDTRPGVVVAPMGYWLSGSRSESTVNAVNSARYAGMGRAPTFSDTLVEVTPID